MTNSRIGDCRFISEAHLEHMYNNMPYTKHIVTTMFRDIKQFALETKIINRGKELEDKRRTN